MRGRQHRDDDANDGDRNDSADRHDQVQTRLIPPRPFSFPGDLRLRTHPPISLTGGATLGRKYCK
jgi:hypothetical protein